jgi:hypothetical protein
VYSSVLGYVKNSGFSKNISRCSFFLSSFLDTEEIIYN